MLLGHHSSLHSFLQHTMALHSKARQLARSGGVRTGSPIVPVPRPPHPRQTKPHRRNRRLGARPQCQPRHGKPEIHYTHHTHQTQASIPFNLNESTDSWRYLMGKVMARKRPKPVDQLSAAEFEAMFPDEDACCAYLVA